jgi:transcriptional antiterminator NusG
MQDKILDILIPTQKKIIVKKGKQDIMDDKLFPGYVLIKMELTPQTWDIVKNTEGVRGFVKTDKYPRPLPESEVKAIMKFMEVEQPSYQSSFSVGEAVKITDGAFADFIGSIQEIDNTKGKVKVLISFLGREAPVELDFSQITKL